MTLSVPICSSAQQNLSLLGSWNFAGQTLAGCWHYIDASGNEYALVGTQFGIAIMDVTVPATPQLLFSIPGINNLWHEVKVWGDFAYAVTEGIDTLNVMNGLQIINLSYLPDSAPYRFWTGDSIISGQLERAHSVTADNGYVYINGHNILSLGRGVLICDLEDPWNPHFVGAVTLNYCHDSYVRGDTIWTSDIVAGGFSVYDITDRYNPVLLAWQQTPYLFNHNAWLSDDGNTIFTTDERRFAPIASYDVSDLSNIELLDYYYTTNMDTMESHNVRVINDFIINASYGSQVTIVDAARPDNLIEVGNYPTGGYLCWDADPYLPSGVILATDMTAGIFYIFQPSYVRACYLEGLVTDSITGFLLYDTKVDILSIGLHDSTNLLGNYKTGYLDSGLYQVTFSRSGYYTKTLPAQLNNGVLTVLDVQLVDSSFSGISEVYTEEMVKVENNPSSSQLTIVISEAAFHSPDPLNLLITDETGRLLMEETDISNSRITLGKKDMASAIYFYKLTAGNKVLGAGKIVLQ